MGNRIWWYADDPERLNMTLEKPYSLFLTHPVIAERRRMTKLVYRHNK